MQPSYFIDLLRGQYEELPNVRSKVVRVFISSTFTDTLAERDSLVEHVFPKLKDYCREKYGLEFQYADMRWGIPNESADNHGEVQTCLNEIETCKKYSLATNFVVLLSHRYGSRPTPATIRASIFEQLLEIIRSNTDFHVETKLISEWYQLDTNQIPSVYVLKPISSMIPQIASSNTTEMKEANNTWKNINSRIRTCLRQAAAKLLEQGKILESEYDDFFISVTEKEIVNGILTVSNANERTLCFLREIEDIYDHLSDPKASKFIDLTHSKDNQLIVDSEAETLLNRLKHKRIPKVLGPNNIYSYKVRWNSGGITRHHHAEYISQFNNDFYNSIQRQIDDCVQANSMIISDPLYREVLEHAIQCKTYISKFHGRIDVIDKLENYVQNSNERRPCVIYGESGCGKTSVLAKATNEIPKWLHNHRVSVILRFLGTTPSSSTIYKTLLSISEQICKLYNLSMHMYADVQQLRHQLEVDLFMQIPENEFLVIILDSIDQLESDAYDCQWLPKIFPKNIKCILSTLPDHGNILSILKSLISFNSSKSDDIQHLFVFVPPFELSIVGIVYDDWLQMKKRSLTNEQREFVNSLMEKQTTILPLFMKLIFDIICTWHSYDPIDEKLKTIKNIDDCIKYLFDHLKAIHNNILFSHSIIYMTAFRNGISQNELEDVLSLDDDVLKSVFQHYIPPVRRIPGILWARIRNDLDEYITEKEADDSSVIFWYHRRFIEVANSCYISKLNSVERATIFQNVVDLYKETWKGKNKPFKVENPNLFHKYNLNESNGEMEGNRLVTSQPIEFVDINGDIQFNKRKLNEMPEFISQLTSNLALPIIADEVIFNYRFMYAKLRCSPFNDIMDLIMKFKQASTYKSSNETIEIKSEIDIFSMIYLITGIQLQEYPDNLPLEISARLLNLFGIKQNITKLIKQFDEQSIQHCALIVPYTQLQPPGSGLLFSVHLHTAAVVEIDFTDNQMTAISLSDRIIVIDMQQVKIVLNVNLPQLHETYLNSTTLPQTNQDDEVNKKQSSNNNDPNRFKKYQFLVNSRYHLYLVSAQEKISFERISKVGFLTVEMLDMDRNLCIIAEINEKYIECWDVIHNRMFDRIKFSSSSIKTVLCINKYQMVITMLDDGSIHFHSITDRNATSFVHRGSIKVYKHIDLLVSIGQFLLCIFNPTSSVRFALINLNIFNNSNKIFDDHEILKTLISFDPPIALNKSIQRIISPEDNWNQSKFPTFIAVTNDSLHVVHQCKNGSISYISIDSQFDIVYIHAKQHNIIYTARGCIIEIYKWSCVEDSKDNCSSCIHSYRLYVSIDTCSVPVTTIAPSNESPTVFLCAMENGLIQAYHSKQARKALKTIPRFPRTKQLIKTIQLNQTIAVTLDDSKRELTAWLYQHETSIESSSFYHDNVIINDFITASSNSNVKTIFVLISTSNHYVEIYLAESLNNEPLFRYYIGCSTKIHSTKSDGFLLLTSNGELHSITQSTNSIGEFIFTHKLNIQLKIQCSMMLSSVTTINSIEYLIIFGDNGRSMAVWTFNKVIYVDINYSSLTSSKLNSIYGEPDQDLILLYFHDKSLISCQIEIKDSINKPSIHMNSCGQTDQFCLKNSCLITLNNKKNQLNLTDIRSHSYSKQIQLNNECLHICLNESATHIFVVVKPHILFMYRIMDGQQLAKLFMPDSVSCMKADNDFIVLGMGDRRLFTLMIADPQDPMIQTKIQSLPSRNSQHADLLSTKQLIEQMKESADDSSSDDKSDSDEDDENGKDQNHNNPINNQSILKKTVPPINLFRLVTRMNGQPSLSKMSKDPVRISQIMSVFSDGSSNQDINHVIDDSDSVDNEEVADFVSTTTQQPQKYSIEDVKDIYQKISEHERQLMKGVQLANAGRNDLKVANNYSITSNTCVLI